MQCIDWHPTKGLIVSGSKDNMVKLWDPRAESAITTLYAHSNSVSCISWHRNGNWFITGSRDGFIKLFDIRGAKEVQVFRAGNGISCWFELVYFPRLAFLCISSPSLLLNPNSFGIILRCALFVKRNSIGLASISQ